jgi:hypothetical protein
VWEIFYLALQLGFVHLSGLTLVINAVFEAFEVGFPPFCRSRIMPCARRVETTLAEVVSV